MIDEILGQMKQAKHGFWGSLIRQGTGVSSLNFYLIVTTLIGCALLGTVVFSIVWEVLHNNIVSSDLSGWAALVGAVSTLFASAGIAKGWSNYSENKFLNTIKDKLTSGNEEETISDEEIVVENPEDIQEASEAGCETL